MIHTFNKQNKLKQRTVDKDMLSKTYVKQTGWESLKIDINIIQKNRRKLSNMSTISIWFTYSMESAEFPPTK